MSRTELLRARMCWLLKVFAVVNLTLNRPWAKIRVLKPEMVRVSVRAMVIVAVLACSAYLACHALKGFTE